jgi:hypothetical protein
MPPIPPAQPCCRADVSGNDPCDLVHRRWPSTPDGQLMSWSMRSCASRAAVSADPKVARASEPAPAAGADPHPASHVISASPGLMLRMWPAGSDLAPSRLNAESWDRPEHRRLRRLSRAAVTGYAHSDCVDHPAITTVVRRSCSGASQNLCAAVRTFGSRPARCTVFVAPRGTAIGAGRPTPAQIRPYVPSQMAAGVYRICRWSRDSPPACRYGTLHAYARLSAGGTFRPWSLPPRSRSSVSAGSTSSRE